MTIDFKNYLEKKIVSKYRFRNNNEQFFADVNTF